MILTMKHPKTRARNIGLSRPALTTLSVAALLGALALILHTMGRIPFCTCGLHLWTADPWSSASSQNFADPYSSSHMLHGMIFYGFLLFIGSFLSRRGVTWLTLRIRFFLAIIIEMAWEILENSPLIIERYRSATASLGYTGDSILNSTGDVLFMMLGFWIALRLPWKWTLALGIAVELVMLWLYRDNLTLNVLMLVAPINAIKSWQMGG